MFGWTVDDICGKSRRRPLVTARQIGMYVMRELTDLSYPRIAEAFGGRDHTTVMYAVDKIKQQMTERHVDLRPGQRADRPHPAREQWIMLWSPGDSRPRDLGRTARPRMTRTVDVWTTVDEPGDRRSASRPATNGTSIPNPQALQQLHEDLISFFVGGRT